MFEKPPLISRSRVGPCPVCRLRDDGRDCCLTLPLDSTVQGHCSGASLPVTAEVPGICRVCYDLTPKPVGTVEWE